MSESLQFSPALIGEPYFTSSSVPWDDLRLWHCALSAPAAFAVYPNSMELVAAPMRFDNLQKLRAPVGQCEGFKLTAFDKLADTGASLAWPMAEAQHLWEYPGEVLAPPAILLGVTFDEFRAKRQVVGESREFLCRGANGLAVWCNWYASGDQFEGRLLLLGTGPKSEPLPVGRFSDWTRHRRQGVLLAEQQREDGLTVTATLDTRSVQLQFSVC